MKHLMRFFTLFCLFFLIFQGKAQEDTIYSDNTIVIQQEKNHSPKIATILSAALPGLGQVYNKSYWKVPVIYAGFAGLGYIASQNHIFYSDFKNQYDAYRTYSEIETAAGRTPQTDTLLTVRGVDGYSVFSVKEGRDYYRRRRDLAIIGIGALYFINIIEAYVHAHMFTFDISENLSIRYAPLYHFSSFDYPTTGIRFTLIF